MGKPASVEAGEGAEVTPGYLPDWDDEGVLVWRVVEENAWSSSEWRARDWAAEMRNGAMLKNEVDMDEKKMCVAQKQEKTNEDEETDVVSVENWKEDSDRERVWPK